MSEKCGGVGTEPEKPTRLWRNGMDYEPKKTNPPDYSNVPSVRDWQMSPFGNERYDLDEIQRAEKRGFKGRFELERLKKELAALKGGDDPCGRKPKEPPCKVCQEREAAANRKVKQKIRCSDEYLYQPYGPSIVSSLSYSRPQENKPRLYSCLGPSHYAGFRFKVPAPETYPTIPCPEYFKNPNQVYAESYRPYGPFGELRFTPDMYTPMGPSTYPFYNRET